MRESVRLVVRIVKWADACWSAYLLASMEGHNAELTGSRRQGALAARSMMNLSVARPVCLAAASPVERPVRRHRGELHSSQHPIFLLYSQSMLILQKL